MRTISSTIGIDIGGTTTQAVLRSSDGQVTHSRRVATPSPGGEAVLKAVMGAVGGFDLTSITGVGVGIPGQVDSSNGTVRWAVNLGIGQNPFPLGDRISSMLDIPVLVENDVRAAAVGVYESVRAAGEPVRDLALISLGTGISAGVVIEGSLHRGSTGMAGEIGHVVVEPDGLLCRCGQNGCLETVAAGPAIAAAWPHGEVGRAASSLFESAARGDPNAQAVADRITQHLAIAIHWLAAAYDVSTIYLGGGVATAGPPFLEAVRGALIRAAGNSNLAAMTLAPERVRLAPDGDHHGAVGAAVLAARHFVLALATEKNQTTRGDE
jgi:predicted NBD/HSP70 family sugar kinase